MTAGILIFVEDPGAANFVASLPPSLEARGLWPRLLASGFAVDQLSALGARFDRLSGAERPSDVLDRWRPTVVVAGTAENPDGFGLALISEARARGWPTVGVVDGPANAALRFRGYGTSSTAHAPDFVLVPDELTRYAHLAAGHDPDRVTVVGHPHYSTVLQQRQRLEAEGHSAVRQRVFPEAPNDKPIIVFLSELSDGLNAKEFSRSGGYLLSGRGEASDRTRIVFEEVLDALQRLRKSVHLIVRLHPKETPDAFAAYRHEIDGISSGGAPFEIVFAADIVVGMTTILLLETLILGRRAISVLPRREEREWLSSPAQEALRFAFTPDEIDRELMQVCGGVEPIAAPSMSYLPLDGLERTADFIHRLARKTSRP